MNILVCHRARQSLLTTNNVRAHPDKYSVFWVRSKAGFIYFLKPVREKQILFPSYKGENDMTKLNRRSFLAAGSALFGTALTGHAVASPVTTSKWDMTTDIVIIGAGGAGLAAAAQAGILGLKCIVLEKEPVIGGSSAVCGGKWAVSGSELQLKQGIKDSEELFVKDMMECGMHKNDLEVVKAYVKENNDTWKWVHTAGKVEPLALNMAGGQSVPRSLVVKPGEVIEFLRKSAVKTGAQIMTRTKAERLIWDFTQNRIAGVRTSRRGKVLFIRATKGVVLAAGGFSRNPQLLKKYAPQLEHAAVIAGLGTQGDGILMAQAYGADMIDTNYIKATYGFSPNASTIAQKSNSQYMGAIAINKFGKRFGNESVSYKLFADWAFAQPEGKSWLVLDDDIRRDAAKKNPTQDGYLWNPIDKGEKPSYVSIGNTIEEAAKNAGLDPKAVAETIKRYNSFVDSGKDEDFNRQGLAAGKSKLKKIEKAPFFIFPATGAMIATYCGVRITPKAQVVDIFGDVIPGLWAAGEMTGGVHGAAYMNGTAFSKAMAFGRIAVKDIAGKI